jgi:hypothetical protein
MDWPYLVAGLVVGTLGWMIYLAGLPAIGLVAGLGTGGALGLILSGAFDNPWAAWVLIALGCLAGGACGFWLVRVFQMYLFFIAGASLGGALGLEFVHSETGSQLVEGSGLAMALTTALAALAGGLLCIKLRRYVMALITSTIGVFLFAEGVPERWRAPTLVIGLVVFLAIQVGLVRRFVDQETFDKRTRVKLREAEAARK